jgi:hypothetical protein
VRVRQHTRRRIKISWGNAEQGSCRALGRFTSSKTRPRATPKVYSVWGTGKNLGIPTVHFIKIKFATHHMSLDFHCNDVDGDRAVHHLVPSVGGRTEVIISTVWIDKRLMRYYVPLTSTPDVTIKTSGDLTWSSKPP